MATVSKELAEQIIAADGYYEDDPRVMQVVKYDGMGGEAWAILYEQDVAINRYAETAYVRNPQIVWSAS